ncbi:MAG: alpha/beta hydrolase [Pseudomonadota bacterium]
MKVRGRFAAVMMIAGLALHLDAFTQSSASAKSGVYVPVTTPASGTINLYAEEHGHGRPILMIHGLAASTYTWRNIVPTLARKNRVITLDMKGFGRSDKPFDTAYSSHDHADLIVAFIRKTKLRNFTLIGHSYGGAVSLLVAEKLRRAGERRIRNMVIMNAPAFPQKPTPFISFMGTLVLPYAVMSLIPPELTAWSSLEPENVLRTSFEDITAYARPYWQASARHALISTARQIVPDDLDAILHGYRKLHQPTLVIWCDRDKTVPIKTGRRLARTLPNARFRVIKGCFHAPQDEQPKAFLRRIRPFINRH